ncbi:MAG: ribosome recycling factor [bacterium]
MEHHEIEKQLHTAIAFYQTELCQLRTGRASPALVEHLRADYYGTPTPLQQLATITTPEPRLLLIEIWDRTVVKNVEKAILQSNLGLQPVVDGQRIRLPMPQLTEERREELRKIARQKAEATRVHMRSIREEAMKTIKRKEKEGELSEDLSVLEQKQVQKIIERYTDMIEEAFEKKSKEILTGA